MDCGPEQVSIHPAGGTSEGLTLWKLPWKMLFTWSESKVTLWIAPFSSWL